MGCGPSHSEPVTYRYNSQRKATLSTQISEDGEVTGKFTFNEMNFNFEDRHLHVLHTVKSLIVARLLIVAYMDQLPLYSAASHIHGPWEGKMGTM